MNTDPAITSGRILLTGGSGFVGRHILRELLARGYDVSCLARQPEKLLGQVPGDLRNRVAVVRGDILESNILARAAQGCAAAIHLIGIIREDWGRGVTFQRMHVEATAAVLRACREAGIKRYVHMSALGTRPLAASRYHQTKWAAEELVRSSGLDWTIFRPSVIHGADSEFMEMMKFFSTSSLRQPFMPYFGSGRARLQPISVEDVATVFVRALGMPETIGQSYELCGPEMLNWLELYDACALAIGGRQRLKVPIPVPVAKLLAAMMPWMPDALAPYKFSVDQVIMSQEDSVCDPAQIEQVFGVKLRGFREELATYAGKIK